MKKIVGKLVIALALTFIIPQLVLVYIWDDFSTWSASLLLAVAIVIFSIGCFLLWDILQSMRSIFKGISDIVLEELKAESLPVDDEFQKMSSSIEIISKKIVENMESLQSETSVIEQTRRDLNEAVVYADHLMNSMGDGLIVIGLDHRIKQMNDAAKKLFGFRGDHWQKQSIDLLFDPNDKPEFSKDSFETGKRMTFITAGGEKIPVDVNSRPILDRKGSLTGYILVTRDLREKLALRSQLAQVSGSLEGDVWQRNAAPEKIHEERRVNDAQIWLQEEMASMDVLTTGITHEINNPLGYISSNLECLQDDFNNILSYTQLLEYGLNTLATENSPEKRLKSMKQFQQVRSEMNIKDRLQDFGAILKESRKGLDRIREIIIDMKRFSSREDHQMEEVDLNDEIQAALNIIRHDLKGKTNIVKDFNPIPLVRCYPHQINQVFMNILINASQALGDSGKITIRTGSKDRSAYVMIQDTGPGIAPEHLKLVFNPFYTTKPPGKGTGLGLYLSQDIIKRHGGMLSVESEVGKGATFTIQLPAVSVACAFETEETIPAL